MGIKRPKPSVIKSLFALSCNQCYYEQCEERLTDVKWSGVKADIAHISGEKANAARYDRSMTDEDRRAEFNLMLLCPNHHRLIDTLEPADHPVERLTSMKERHQRRCQEAMEWNPTDEELDQLVDRLLEQLERQDEEVGSGDDARDDLPLLSVTLRDIELVGGDWLVRLNVRNESGVAASFGARIVETTNLAGPEAPWWVPWRHDRARFARLFPDDMEILRVGHVPEGANDKKIVFNVQPYDNEDDVPHLAIAGPLPASATVRIIEMNSGEAVCERTLIFEGSTHSAAITRVRLVDH